MKQVFEYAVIRVMPRVEREEFINVGVILYCKRLKYIGSIVAVNEDRLCCFAGADEVADIKANLAAFENICKGDKGSGPIGQLDEASRFRWLTATRSTVVQASKVHPGMTDDPAATLQRLLEQLVL
ncbi:DUF3037 domain-containing protein [Mucilaginibacter myungsuensis]|uniref:DUF3037 domain-containing protein n=1 Tax=Mucilaginibacter myungsuensis TaxID=649104 RepID=A0A929PXW5_9SPHI|nr:DUF3037 domain-containing protein [Mucilaginibacter myungsuensis]MBE9663559.1 DUF3037 domain-containing protein [Mucilaginibacter myungsuensis]MDN3599117.1 DUF3037 domain-containing protein [Mucilaginibacter myungsuensis]